MDFNVMFPGSNPAAKPHFVVFSFYKFFGYPTGVGVLLVRRDSCHLLRGKR